MSVLQELKWQRRSGIQGLRAVTGKGQVQGRDVHVSCSNWLSATGRFHVVVKIDKWPLQYISDLPCDSPEEGLGIAEVELVRLLAVPPRPRDRIRKG
jgi:hypothetical protein